MLLSLLTMHVESSGIPERRSLNGKSTGLSAIATPLAWLVSQDGWSSLLNFRLQTHRLPGTLISYWNRVDTTHFLLKTNKWCWVEGFMHEPFWDPVLVCMCENNSSGIINDPRAVSRRLVFLPKVSSPLSAVCYAVCWLLLCCNKEMAPLLQTPSMMFPALNGPIDASGTARSELHVLPLLIGVPGRFAQSFLWSALGWPLWNERPQWHF